MASNATTTTTAAPHIEAASTDFFQATDSPLAYLLIQMMVVVGLSSIMARLFAFIKQPSVIAQIITGIVLGPTALSRSSSFSSHIFPASTLTVFNTLADFGLVWFMLLIGLEVNIDILRLHLRHSATISIAGVVIPFFLGVSQSFWLADEGYKVEGASQFHFSLFIGVAMAITAFPVLARIISERSLLGTDLGLLILGSAAVDDLIAWIILALIVALVRAGSGINVLYVLITVSVFFLFMAFVAKPILAKLCERGINNQRVFVFMLLCVMACAWFTEAIGIHAIFGGFVFGLIVPRTDRININMAHKIEDYVVSLLLPLYFCKSGLRTSLGDIHTGRDWGACIFIVAIACIGKIIPGYIVARLCGRTHKEAGVVGFLRNAKGLVELIVLNIGLDLKIISPAVFAMLVFMAVITTLSASPLMYLVYTPKQIIEDDRIIKEQRLSQIALGKDGEAGAAGLAPVVKEPPKDSLLLCYKTETEALPMMCVGALLNPTPGNRLQLARIHEVNEKPSSFIDAGAHYIATAQYDDIMPANTMSSEMSTVLRLRARILGVPCGGMTLSTPWYTDPSEQILGAIKSTHSTLVLLPPGDSPLPLARKLLIGSDVGSVGIVTVKGHVDIEEDHPVKRALLLYYEDTAGKPLLTALSGFARNGHANGTEMTLLYNDEIEPEDLEVLNAMAADHGVKLVAHNGGVTSFQTDAVQNLTTADEMNATYDTLVFGLIDDLGHPTPDHPMLVRQQQLVECSSAKLCVVLYTIDQSNRKDKPLSAFESRARLLKAEVSVV